MSNRELLITDIIYTNPGIHFSEIMRMSGMKNGVLSHYLGKLEEHGIVDVERSKMKTRLFPPKISLEERKIILFLRKETCYKIIFSLINNNGLEFREIVKEISKSSPTTSQNLTELIQNNLVVTKLEGSKKKYFIKKNSFLVKLIKKYQFD